MWELERQVQERTGPRTRDCVGRPAGQERTLAAPVLKRSVNGQAIAALVSPDPPVVDVRMPSAPTDLEGGTLKYSAYYRGR